jgi:glutamine synthetase
VRRIPSDLREALDALEADPVVLDALPGDMRRVFFHLKRDEWARFMATVTEWDYERFLEYLP